jgi:SAM-dependent methyltransferase
MENFLLGMGLSEFHSGYRLYSVPALAQLPFESNTDDFHFDTEIIIQLQAAGMRIIELPIPCYYGDEICYVNGMRYAWDVTMAVLRYKLHEFGVRSDPAFAVQPRYTMKKSPLGSHARIIQLCGPQPRRVLDIGSGTGELARALAARGHQVTSVDRAQPPSDGTYRAVQADVSGELPLAEDERFDVVILADVLEHLAEPWRLLREALARLTDDGFAIVSLPNAVHWSVRGQVAVGRFEYANKGLLDRGHLRFFTQATARRMFADGGFVVQEWVTTPVPWENVVPKALGEGVSRSVERADYFVGRLLPNLFAYQHLFVLKKAEPA